MDETDQVNGPRIQAERERPGSWGIFLAGGSAGLVLGLLSVFFFFGTLFDLLLIIPAFIFSILGLAQARVTGVGRAMARWGLGLAICATVLALTLTVVAVVLISGRGSNMSALIEAAKAPGYPAEIVLVVANKPDAGGVAAALAEGVSALVVASKPPPFQSVTLLRTALITEALVGLGPAASIPAIARSAFIQP